jgi:hypothetical protein
MESPQRKLGDCSDPFYMRARTEFLNPPNGSWEIVQIVWVRQNCLAQALALPDRSRKDLNNPPTSVGGIYEAALLLACR